MAHVASVAAARTHRALAAAALNAAAHVVARVMRRKTDMYAVDAHAGVAVLESQLRVQVEAQQLEEALNIFERLLRRRRTPSQSVCTQLLELCVQHAPRRALYVLEGMSEVRGLDVDDYCRIVRLLIMKQIEPDRLARFEEVAIDMLSFADDAMHNYFAHLSSLLNLELHEQVCRPAGRNAEMDVSLITHKRMIDASAKLCKRGSLATPIVDLLLYGMGGREGAQSESELKRLADASTGLAGSDQLQQAHSRLATFELNPSQQAAAKACLERRLTLVQGPPGTGKTKVAVSVIELWVRDLGIRPVLACADSNVAVDNIGLALLRAGLNIVRPGRPDAVHPSLHCVMPENLGGPLAIGGADVVLCTCVGSGADSIAKHNFAAVLIDETAQSTEPSCLVPLCHGCRQLALVGDHKQLRPTVVSDEAARQGLQLSVFERLLRSGVTPHLLDTQYRMHPSLADFASAEFYAGRLLSGTSPESRPPVRGFAWPSARVNVALVVSNAQEEGTAGASKRNQGEASTVTSIVRSVLAAGELAAAQIGVVTPYASQVSLVRQLLAAMPAARGVEVKSVDGFQGREKELIVFSAVRAGRGGSLGFVSDARRLNVLLTRAKRGFIVVGEPRTLVHSSHWANWLAWVQKERAVCGSPAWTMPPRPSRRRERSPSSDREFDELGRKLRCRSPSAERAAPIPSRRAARREARKARKLAAADAGAVDGAVDEEAQWRQTLLEAAEQAEARGGRHPNAFSVDGEPLLPHWYRADDPASGGVYYHNAATLEVCWQVPLAARRPLPAAAAPPAPPAASELDLEQADGDARSKTVEL